MKAFTWVAASLLIVGCGSGQRTDLSDASATAASEQAQIFRSRTRVLILRHAEKANGNDWNTDLSSPEGFARAEAWVDILADRWPDALFVSNLQRTQHTLQPTADALGLTPQIRPALVASPERPTVEDTQALAAEILSAHRGETVVVCWHTPYVEDLARALGVPAEKVPEWSHSTYDHLWTVTIRADGTARLFDDTF